VLKLFSATNRCFHQGHKCDIYSSCASLALTVSSLPRARPQPLSEAKTASHRVFRHVGLGLRLLVPPIATIVRPIEEHLLFPQESTALQLQSTIAIVVSRFRKLFQRTISAEKKHGDSWSASYGHVL